MDPRLIVFLDYNSIVSHSAESPHSPPTKKHFTLVCRPFTHTLDNALATKMVLLKTRMLLLCVILSSLAVTGSAAALLREGRGRRDGQKQLQTPSPPSVSPTTTETLKKCAHSRLQVVDIVDGVCKPKDACHVSKGSVDLSTVSSGSIDTSVKGVDYPSTDCDAATETCCTESVPCTVPAQGNGLQARSGTCTSRETCVGVWMTGESTDKDWVRSSDCEGGVTPYAHEFLGGARCCVPVDTCEADGRQGVCTLRKRCDRGFGRAISKRSSTGCDAIKDDRRVGDPIVCCIKDDMDGNEESDEMEAPEDDSLPRGLTERQVQSAIARISRQNLAEGAIYSLQSALNMQHPTGEYDRDTAIAVFRESRRSRGLASKTLFKQLGVIPYTDPSTGTLPVIDQALFQTIVSEFPNGVNVVVVADGIRGDYNEMRRYMQIWANDYSGLAVSDGKILSGMFNRIKSPGDAIEAVLTIHGALKKAANDFGETLGIDPNDCNVCKIRNLAISSHGMEYVSHSATLTTHNISRSSALSESCSHVTLRSSEYM